MILVTKPKTQTRPLWEKEPTEPSTIWLPFEMTDWPYELGQRVDTLEIEGFIISGAFATKKEGKVFTIQYDHFELR